MAHITPGELPVLGDVQVQQRRSSEEGKRQAKAGEA